MQESLVLDDTIKMYVKKNVNIEDDISIENVLIFLKNNNVSQFVSLYLLVTECNISFHKANLYVMNSKAWNGYNKELGSETS